MSFYDTYDDLTQLNEGSALQRANAMVRDRFWTNAKSDVLDVNAYFLAYRDDMPEDLYSLGIFEQNGLLKNVSVWNKIAALDANAGWVKALKKFWYLQFKTPNINIINTPELHPIQDEKNLEDVLESAADEIQGYLDQLIDKQLFERVNKLYKLSLQNSELLATKTHVVDTTSTYPWPKVWYMKKSKAIHFMQPYLDVIYCRSLVKHTDIRITEDEYTSDPEGAAERAADIINKFYQEQIVEFTNARLAIHFSRTDDLDKYRRDFPWFPALYRWVLNGGVIGHFIFQDANGKIRDEKYKSLMTLMSEISAAISINILTAPVSIVAHYCISEDHPNYKLHRQFGEDQSVLRYISLSKNANQEALKAIRAKTDGSPTDPVGKKPQPYILKPYKLGITKAEAEQDKAHFYIDGMDTWAIQEAVGDIRTRENYNTKEIK